jgi:hypothetical protein
MRFHAVGSAAALALVVFVAPANARSDGRSPAAFASPGGGAKGGAAALPPAYSPYKQSSRSRASEASRGGATHVTSDGRSSAATDEAGKAQEHARAAIATMSERATLLMRMLREARTEHRSRPEVSCVDGALTRADVAVRRAREDADRAAGAYERGDLLEARAAVAAIDARDGLSRAALVDARACMRQ